MPTSENVNEKEVNAHAYFYNSKNGDRKYNGDGHSDFMSPFFAPGVFQGDLQVIANDDMTVTIGTGYAWVPIEGDTIKRLKHFKQPTIKDIETASGTLDRIDTIVVRRNDTDRDITIEYVKGGLSSEPESTPPTRAGAIYELILCKIKIPAGTVRITQDMIEDSRRDPDLCGYVAATIKEIDFKQITAQFDAFFKNYEGKVEDRFEAYNDYIALLQQQGDNEYRDLLELFKKWTEAYQETFETWFQKMKDQLSEDAAGNLQNEVDETDESVFNRFYGLLKSTANIIKENGKTVRVEMENDEATGTTTFAEDAAAGTKTITAVIVPKNGTEQFRKTTVITKLTDKTVVSTTYTKEMKGD